MRDVDRKEKMKKYEIHHSTDIMVQVDTLGEGYDNVLISVAIIFTPMMNIPSFAQFIGRAVRKITTDKVSQGLKPTPADNVTHVIALSAFNYVSNWIAFAKQNTTKKSYVDNLLDAEIEAAQHDGEEDVSQGTVLYNPRNNADSQPKEEESEEEDVSLSIDGTPTDNIALHRRVLARTQEMETTLLNEEKGRPYSRDYDVVDHHHRFHEANGP